MRAIRAEYVSRLDEMTLAKGRVRHFGDNEEVTVVSYSDIPEPGFTTLFSFGLSCAAHKEWVYGRPELVISVRSNSSDWAILLGELVLQHRSAALFEYGTVLNFRRTLEPGCRMTSLLIFVSNILDQEQQRVELPDRIVNIAQLYPVYAEEADLIRRIGVEEFYFRLGIDFENLHRHSMAEASA